MTATYRAILIPVCLAWAVSAARAQTSATNTVRLQATGQTIEAATSWDEQGPVILQFPAALPQALCDKLRITYRWDDEIKEPGPLLIERAKDDEEEKKRKLQECAEDDKPPTFTIARENPNRKMLTYLVWEVLPPDPTIPATGNTTDPTNDGDRILAERDRLGLTGDVSAPDRIREFIANIEAAIGVSAKTVPGLAKAVAAGQRTLAEHEADAKLYAGMSDPAAVKALDGILTNIRNARAQLNKDQAALRAENERAAALKQLLVDVKAYQLAIVEQHHVCARARVLKIGGLLPSERSKSVYYNFTSSPAPPGLALLLLAGYPRITQDDRLFAIVANRQLSIHPFPFALSATRNVTAPPILAAVRPTFDVTKAIAPGTERAMIATMIDTPPKQACDAKFVPVEEQSLRAAFRDSVLPFQDRFVGNDVLAVSISTYVPHTTTDKITTTTEGEKTTVTKQNVEESKVVDLLKDVKYPQVRALYRFNFAMGVVVSRLEERPVVKIKTAANDPDTQTDEARYRLQEAEGTSRVFPAFLFSTYIKRVDIQDPVWSKCRRGLFGWCPGWRSLPAPSLGFAITNPADNVFVGFTSEVFENIHVYFGGHNGKISEVLEPVDADGQPIVVSNADRDSTDPKTQSVRRWDLSYGVTFNINIVGSWFK